MRQLTERRQLAEKVERKEKKRGGGIEGDRKMSED